MVNSSHDNPKAQHRDPATHPGVGAQQRSIGELFSSITGELTGIVKREIAIAKIELKVQAIRAGIGAAGFVIAGLFAFFALIMLLFAAAYGLVALGIWEWAAFLIVAGALLLLAAIAALVGLNRVKAVRPPERTIETSQESVQALKGVSHATSASYDDVFEDLYGHRTGESKKK